jgi:hypothetical protein
MTHRQHLQLPTFYPQMLLIFCLPETTIIIKQYTYERRVVVAMFEPRVRVSHNTSLSRLASTQAA